MVKFLNTNLGTFEFIGLFKILIYKKGDLRERTHQYLDRGSSTIWHVISSKLWAASLTRFPPTFPVAQPKHSKLKKFMWSTVCRKIVERVKPVI